MNCRDCQKPLMAYRNVREAVDNLGLCDACVQRYPQRRAGRETITTVYQVLAAQFPQPAVIQTTLFDAPESQVCIAPANWQELPPWRDDVRVIDGERVRSAYPLYYQDSDGVVWVKKHDISGEYERWQG